tara:strand:- start:11 stop:292 length:282 start_codon:yes stop_codon:yes gene_type:complete
VLPAVAISEGLHLADKHAAPASSNEVKARLAQVLRDKAEHIPPEVRARQLRARVPHPVQRIEAWRHRSEKQRERLKGAVCELAQLNGVVRVIV